MNYLSKQDLEIFFQRKNNRYVNTVGMEIGRNKKNGIWTYFVHRTYDQGPWEVAITTEFDDLESFTTGFKLQSFQELDKLDYTSSWMRYLNGEAEIIITPSELEIPFTFRIHNYRTIIFSLEKHFYDEVGRHLIMPEDFEKYFHQNQKLHNKIYGINF